jgi:hypothetical protein
MDERLFHRPAAGERRRVPVLVVGGSTAAYAATLAALRAGSPVLLAQPTRQVGGQFTAQALPAPDDPPQLAPKRLQPRDRLDPAQLEDGQLFCGSRSMRAFRERQRQLQPVAGAVVGNPGASWVSHFSVRPDTAANALEEPLLPYLASGALTLVPEVDPVALEWDGGAVRAVTFLGRQDGSRFSVEAEVVIEATDLGDLLEVGGIAARIGQEGRGDTGEAVLPAEARPECQQAFTFGIVVEKAMPRDDERLPAPAGLDREPWLHAAEFPAVFWVRQGDGWQGRGFFESGGMFRYRRLACSASDAVVRDGDVTVLNWGVSPHGTDDGPPGPGERGNGNDYRHGNLVGVSRAERTVQLQRGRERAQAYLHVLQSRWGLPLRPRGDLTWTPDGIALEPYIREARRGVALTTIRHEDVAARFFPGAARARTFDDSVGIGAYHYLDFHPNLAEGHVDLGSDGATSLPFTIPLGALLPVDADGLVLSAKSIGTTHITNAAYRMHPVEWAIGEAGGRLAAFAVGEGVRPRDVRADQGLLRRFQAELCREGIPIVWFNDVGHDDPDFAAIQVLAAAGILPGEEPRHLRFVPAGRVSRAVAAVALVGVLGLAPASPAAASFVDVPPDHVAFGSIETLRSLGVVAGVGNGRFAPAADLTREQLAILIARSAPAAPSSLWPDDLRRDRQALLRRELSRVLHRLLEHRLGGAGGDRRD